MSTRTLPLTVTFYCAAEELVEHETQTLTDENIHWLHSHTDSKTCSHTQLQYDSCFWKENIIGKFVGIFLTTGQWVN